MYFLLIDTASERGLVAISTGDTLLFQRELPNGLHNSHTLLPTISESLQTIKLHVNQLSAIIVGCGPGTYTGMRVGAMTAKALAYGAKVPLVGICSLECYQPHNDGSFAILVDAKIGGIYCLAGIQTNGIISYKTEPQVGPIEEFTDLLLQTEQIVTPCAGRLRPKIAGALPSKEFNWQECSLNSLRMGRLALERFQQGAISDSLELLYLTRLYEF